MHYGLYTGLSGIGWGIEYLYQQGFIAGNINEILENFDKKIMEINPQRITNLDKAHGFGGIVLYLLARLHTIEKENKNNPFDCKYLKSVYVRIEKILKERDITTDSIDVFLDFVYYYKDKKEINQPEIRDIWNPQNPENIPLQDLPLTLQGAVGIGLKLILDSNK